VVCPTESLIFGDIEDPASRAAQIIASRPTTVRRPEQGTRPQAYYVGASPVALDPLAPAHGDRYMWADRRTGGAKDYTSELVVTGGPAVPGSGRSTVAGTLLPVISGGPAPLGAPRGPGIAAPPLAAAPAAVADEAGPATWYGPVDPELTRPGTRVAYDVFHPRPWGWKVALYLWTKGIGAGAFGLIFLAAALGVAPVDQLTRVVAATIAWRASATTLLLVADLKRPERFLSILYRPQRRSWLAIGAFILVGYSGLLGLWWLGTLLGMDDGVLTALGWPAFGLAVMTALYTMFLLRQCEARDLWQRPVVGVVLIAQATILGAATLIPALLVLDAPAALVDVAAAALLAGGAVNLVALLLGEAFASHPTATRGGAPARSRALRGRLLDRGRDPRRDPARRRGGAWVGLAVAGAAAAPILLAAGLAAAVGLLWYELGFITAGQAVPIS
jgi:formate-dependent nitrite reductase membrane component NrfD